MTSLRKLLGTAAAYTFANALNGAIPFLLLPILTRVLSPADYGTATMFITVMSVLAALTGLCVHGAISVRYFDRSIDHPRFVGTSLAILAASSAMLLLVIWAAAVPLSGATQVPISWLLVAAVSAAGQFIIQIRLMLWQVESQVVRYGCFLVASTALNFGLSLVLVTTLAVGWEGRALGVTGAVLSFATLALISLHRQRLVRWVCDADYARVLLRFGIPLIPHTIGGLLLVISDRFVIASLLGADAVGVYAAAMQVGLVVAVVADACNKAFAPWLFRLLSERNEASNLRLIRQTYLLFLAMPLLAVCFGAAAPFMLSILVGEQYPASAEVVFFISLGSAFGGMYYLVANYIFFSGKTGRLAAVTLSCGALNVILTWWLVRAYGASGAAYAYCASQAVFFVITWTLAARVYPMPWLQCALAALQSAGIPRRFRR